MPLYSRTGDAGETGLSGTGNQRVPKYVPRIEACGTLDELNAFLGLYRSEASSGELPKRMRRIQATLFEIGADLAAPGSRSAADRVTGDTAQLEAWIDESEGQLEKLSSFILPGGHREAALLHMLRSITRRAERAFWALQRQRGQSGEVEEVGEVVPVEFGIYLNRLSDLFFSWARLRNQQEGVAEEPWTRS